MRGPLSVRPIFFVNKAMIEVHFVFHSLLYTCKSMQNLSEKISAIGGDIFLVQVGGNDGSQDDPVRSIILNNPRIRAWILEPIPKYFRQLQEGYKDVPRVTCVCAAMSDTTGTAEINFVDWDESMPLWVKGCSSFHTDKNVLSGFGNIGLTTKMEPEFMAKLDGLVSKLTVPTISLNDFIEQQQIPRVDVWITDTEGHDWVISRQWMSRPSGETPKVMFMEHHTLYPEEKTEMFKFFSDTGYGYTELGFDVLATRI